MKCKIIIKSNSEYSYLWQIINDLTINLMDVNICIDSNDINFKFNDNINVIFYDKNLNYTKRLINILHNIDCEYVLLLHDVDLILNFNINIFNKYLNMFHKFNLDRLSFGVYDNKNDIICDDDLQICKLKENMSLNFHTPFDYTPSIFRTSKLINLYQSFDNETYGNLEQRQDVQQYVNHNMCCYGIQKNENIKLVYHRGFVFSEDLSFLHITIKGMFLPIEYYYDLKETLLYIIQKYNLNFIHTKEQRNFIYKNIL